MADLIYDALVAYGNAKLEEAAEECEIAITNVANSGEKPLETGFMIGPLLATKENILALKETP